MYATLLDPGASVTHRFRRGFKGYVFVVHGAAHVGPGEGGGVVDEGGAAKVQEEPEVTVRAGDDGAEILLVETRAIADR